MATDDLYAFGAKRLIGKATVQMPQLIGNFDLIVEAIGNATGAGYETAKSRLRYAYARLRKELEAWR